MMEDEFAWASNTLDRDEKCMQNFYRETSRKEILDTLMCRREDVILEFVVKMKNETHRPPFSHSKYSTAYFC